MINISGYNIVEKIYEGKKVVLYKGREVGSERKVLLKFLREEYPPLSDIARLQHEYDISKKITSTSIVKVYKVEEFQRMPVLVLEDFDGESLQNLLKGLKKIPLMTFLQLGIQLAEALSDIYNSSVIHKDINPNNIIVNMSTGITKITDFGIASLLSNERKGMTSVQLLEGTIHYMSPEQTGRTSRPVDYHTDFYSLGITFYQMITGVLPFKAMDELGIIHCHLAVEPVPPHKVNSQIPQVISEIILKLMEKMAENRYQSALGLKSDLVKCLNQLQAKGSIEYFKIGKNDYSDRLQIPEKLYGKEKELGIIQTAFAQICKGKKEVIMVTGYSGAGKSMLSNEIRNTIAKKKGHFISGKFDQFQLDIPYSALAQAFKQLVQQLLTANKEQIQAWKKELLQALGSNGKIISTVIPEIEKIIGPQPDIIELPAEEAKNRFHLTFQNFVKIFCNTKHPLVIYLDDLQWADLSTLTLLEVLVRDVEIKHLLLISTYREKEVHDLHPLMLLLKNLEQEKITISTIFLTPMSLTQIGQLLSDTLSCPEEDVYSLAELSLQKTEGNPFFLSQFLHSLHREGLIFFDRDNYKWRWDLKKIQQAGITDNVVELIANRIQKLSLRTQEIVKLAACIGFRFELKTIAMIQNKTVAESYDDLWEALQEGLLSLTEDVHYSFLHFRIHQSAYSLLEKEEAKENHLKIGRLLLMNTNDQEMDEHLLDIVNQFNRALELVLNPLEREKIAYLELLAGKKAKKATAYDTAYIYFKIGLTLLEESSFTSQYELAFSLTIEAAETAYLSGDFDGVESYTEILLQNALTLPDKIKAYEIKILAYVSQNRLTDAITTGLMAFGLLGVHFPKNPTKLHIFMELLKIKAFLRGKDENDLLTAPVAVDATSIAINGVLFKMGLATYKASPNLCLLLILKGIETGNTTIGYMTYGMLLCRLGDINSGYKFGELSLQLLEKSNHKELTPKMIVFFNTFIIHHKSPLKNSLAHLLEGYLIGLETGDINYACMAIFVYCYHSYFAGKKLARLDEEMTSFYKEVCNSNNKNSLDSQLIFHQTIKNLRGCSENPCIIEGGMYNATTILASHLPIQDKNIHFDLHLNTLILCYLFGEYDKALENGVEAQKYLETVSGTYSFSVYFFYYSLAMLANAHKLSGLAKQQLLWKVASHQRKLKKRASYAPMNFSHKYYLIKAETSRVSGNNLKAMEYYQKAIELAGENHYLQEEALANELAGKFYLARKELKIAKSFITGAHYSYTLWGATAKVEDLERKYPQFLLGIYDRRNTFQKSATYTKSSNSTNDIILDNATILKVTQLISGEIILEELLKKLIAILLENAGAQRVVYLTKGNKSFLVQAEGWAEDKKIQLTTGLTLEDALDLPKQVLNYVEHTKENIILSNACLSVYKDDPYISEHQHKSIMCMPILSKDEIIGILYLENTLIEGAFSLERVEMLNVISKQLAISLENSKLYTTLELSEEKYRKLVDNMSEGVCIIQDGIIEFVNKALMRITNYNADELLGQNFTHFLTEKDAELINEYYSKKLAGEDVPGEYELSIVKDQTVQCTVIFNFTIITFNDKLATLVTLRDITARKAAEEEIRMHRDRLEYLVEERTSELKAEIVEREKAQKLLEEMATHDTLTGLSNRMLFHNKLQVALETAQKRGSLLSVLFIDLDGFKSINDNFGHTSGDIVLKIVAMRLLKSVRSSDSVSRLGGDEFTIIMENPNESCIHKICQRIIHEISQPIILGNNEGFVTVSIGISLYPRDGVTMDQLIKKADSAMYIAKKSGKNRFVFSSMP